MLLRNGVDIYRIFGGDRIYGGAIILLVLRGFRVKFKFWSWIEVVVGVRVRVRVGEESISICIYMAGCQSDHRAASTNQLGIYSACISLSSMIYEYNGYKYSRVLAF